MPLFLVRHARAGVRNPADPDDVERQLDDVGKGQAAGLVAQLSPEPIERVLSSPARRCIQTVEPLARAAGLDVEPATPLLEGSAASATIEFVRSFTGHCVVLCSHGDVIPDVLRLLELGGTRLEGRGCAKGSVWALENDTERIESASYLGPIELLQPSAPLGDRMLHRN